MVQCMLKYFSTEYLNRFSFTIASVELHSKHTFIQHVSVAPSRRLIYLKNIHKLHDLTWMWCEYVSDTTDAAFYHASSSVPNFSFICSAQWWTSFARVYHIHLSRASRSLVVFMLYAIVGLSWKVSRVAQIGFSSSSQLGLKTSVRSAFSLFPRKRI